MLLRRKSLNQKVLFIGDERVDLILFMNYMCVDVYNFPLHELRTTECASTINELIIKPKL